MASSSPIQRGGLITRLKDWTAKRRSRHSAAKIKVGQASGIEIPDGQVHSTQPSPSAAGILTTFSTDVPDACVEPSVSAPSAQDDETDPSPECCAESTEKAPDLWLEAFEQVDDETKKLINRNPSLPDNTAQIDELTHMVKDKVETFKGESWKMNVNGKERTWSANGQRVIAGIQDIGNIVIAFAPEPASTIWSAVKVLLNTHASQCKDMIAILGCAEKVLPIVKRAKIYENLYLENMGDTLRDSLLAVYTEVIKLLVYTGDYLSKIGAERFFEALKHPGKGEEFLKSLTDAETRLNHDAQACIAVNIGQTSDRIQELHIPLRLVNGRIAEVHEYVKENDLKFALNYISRIKVGEQHDRRLEGRLQGTGEWLFEHEDFEDWETSDSSSFLWLTGQVGAGKSILTSHVVDRYDSPASTHFGGGLAFFYFSKTDKGTLDTPLLHVLQSFVRQLAVVSHQPQKIYAGLVEKCRDLESHTRSFNAGLCKEIITDIVNNSPNTTLILDGLDEFPRDDLYGIITFLSQLAKNAKRPLKVFISSRNEPYIRTMLQGSQAKLKQITIVDENYSDIRNFVEDQTNTVIEYFRATMEPEQRLILKRDIIKVIGEEAKGMFIWASLQLAQLKECDTETQVRRRLGKLPKTLTEAYNELYDIKPESQKYLRRAVTWVMYARRPLSTEQILAAVRLSQHHVGNNTKLKVDEERLTEPAFEKTCRYLIVKDRQGHWKLPHASVEEFFQDHENERLKDWIGDKAKIEVAKLSVLLLTSYDNWSDVQTYLEIFLAPRSSTQALFAPKTPKSALQGYIGEHWVEHVGEIRPQTEAYEQVAHLLKCFLIAGDGTYCSSLEYRSWLEYWAKASFDRSKALGMRPAKNSAFGIVILGLFAMTKYWGTEQLDLKQINDRGFDLLALAASNAQAEVCEALMGLGSDANRLLRDPKHPSGTSALCAAVKASGGAACVKTLLKHGADPNLETGSRALCCAADNDAVEVLHLLLDHEANPNALCKDCHYECALEAATTRGSIDAIDLLIKAGAEVKLPYGRHQMTPLMSLVHHHYLPEAIEALISHGADVHVSSGPYGGVMGAAFCGSVSDQVVPYLIEKVGTDPHRMLSDVTKQWPSVWGPGTSSREKTARYLLQHKRLAPEDFRGLDNGQYLPPIFIENFKLEETFLEPKTRW